MSTATLPNRFLFVDDDRSMRVLFANAARAIGTQAVLAESTGQAIELVQRRQFSVVVADLNMRGFNGLALVERLSAIDRATAFVLVTAASEIEAGLSIRADGAIASLLGKPIEMNDLRDALTRAYALHLGRRAALDGTRAAAPWSVLMVEDSPGDADLLADYLADIPDLELVQVSRLSEALELTHDHQFDAIITDLGLPDARGFDAVLRLQASAPHAAILVYSGVDDEPLALQLLQLGAQDYLVKGAAGAAQVTRALRFARERKQSELRLRRLAHSDQLTGLVNPASFKDAVIQGLARAQRNQQLLAVLMVDLDGFKKINDTSGHEAGDQVLQEVGVRLRCQFREYDVVARLGGDEFAVLVTDVESIEALGQMAERLLISLAQPIGEAGHRITGSVGIAVFPQAGHCPATLLRSADVAMYRAKHSGKNRSLYYDGPVPVAAPLHAVWRDPDRR